MYTKTRGPLLLPAAALVCRLSFMRFAVGLVLLAVAACIWCTYKHMCTSIYAYAYSTCTYASVFISPCLDALLYVLVCCMGVVGLYMDKYVRSIFSSSAHRFYGQSRMRAAHVVIEGSCCCVFHPRLWLVCVSQVESGFGNSCGGHYHACVVCSSTGRMQPSQGRLHVHC